MAIKRRKKLSKKEEKALTKKNAFVVAQSAIAQPEQGAEPEKPKQKPVIEIGENVVIRDFASILDAPVTEVIKVLMKNGVLKNLNESIDWDTAAIVADEFGFEAKLKKEEKPKIPLLQPERSRKEDLEQRPPVVTVMGHVDHGKTKLLDTIRQTDVIATESGGITQHIGAYQIEFQGKKITFIDTPGHAAFESMRAHGANITDIVILVVAADEGLKPQTLEAYEHAKRAGVPIIVAINKIDLPNANVQKVKQQLVDIGLICEDMGGKTICVSISAKQNLNIDELLEMILLFSELKNYKANPKKPAQGVVIESHLDPKLGSVASLLVQDGTLREGDFLVLGDTWGKVRLLEDENKKRLKTAGPAKPVLIAGLKQLPSFGQVFQAVKDERIAQQVLAEIQKTGAASVKLTSALGEKEYAIALKADVFGSLEAIKDNLKKIQPEGVNVNIVREGVGDITEDDVMMAKTSKATVYGFKVKTFVSASKIAQKEKVKILNFDVIYDLIDDIKAVLDQLAKKEVQTLVGKGRILKIFRTEKAEKIVGVKVVSGQITKGLVLKIKRGEEEIGEGKLTSLQAGKEKVEIVEKGTEAGLGVATQSDLQESDTLEFYKKEIV